MSLPAWAVVTPERRTHIERVAALLAAWADALGVPDAERARADRDRVVEDDAHLPGRVREHRPCGGRGPDEPRVRRRGRRCRERGDRERQGGDTDASHADMQAEPVHRFDARGGRC